MIGFIIGLFIGANIGALIIGLCQSASRTDKAIDGMKEVKR